jgi:hypothetical protein
MRATFFIFSITLTFLHCNNTPTPPQYILNTYVRYDAAQRAGQAEATFRTNTPGSTSAQTPVPGGVECQGKKMNLLKEVAPVYKVRMSDYSEKYAFTWRDSLSGVQTTFEVPMLRADSFWFEKTPVSKGQTATLRWTGGDLKKGETLVLIWQNASGQTVQTEAFNPAGMASLELPSAKLAELTPGDWRLYLVRKQLTKTTLQGCEATGIAEYYTKERTFKITQ